MPHVGVEWFTRLSLADRGQDAAKAQRLCVHDDHQISKALRRLHVPTFTSECRHDSKLFITLSRINSNFVFGLGRAIMEWIL